MSFRLGYYLVQKGTLTLDQVDRATRRQHLLGGTLDTQLLELGWLDIAELTAALEATFDSPKLPQEWLTQPHKNAFESVPKAIATQFSIVPLAQDTEGLHILAADQGAPIEELPLRYWLNVPIQVYRVPHLRIIQALDSMYGCTIPSRFSILSKRFPVDTLFQMESVQTEEKAPDVTTNTVSQTSKEPKAERTSKALSSETTTQDSTATESTSSTQPNVPTEHTEPQPVQNTKQTTAVQDVASSSESAESTVEAPKVENEEPIQKRSSSAANASKESHTASSVSQEASTKRTSESVEKDTQVDKVLASESTQQKPKEKKNNIKGSVASAVPSTDSQKRTEQKTEPAPLSSSESVKNTTTSSVQENATPTPASASHSKKKKETNKPPMGRRTPSRPPQSFHTPLPKSRLGESGDRKSLGKQLDLPSLERLRSAFRPAQSEETEKTPASQSQPSNAQKSTPQKGRKPQKDLRVNSASTPAAAPPQNEKAEVHITSLDFPDTLPGQKEHLFASEPVSSMNQTLHEPAQEQVQQEPVHILRKKKYPTEPTVHTDAPMAQSPLHAIPKGTQPFIQSSAFQAKPSSMVAGSNVSVAMNPSAHLQQKNNIPLMAGSFQEAMTIPGLPAFPADTQGASNEVHHPMTTVDDEQLAARIQQMTQTPPPLSQDIQQSVRDYLEAATPQYQQELKNKLAPSGGTLIPTLLEYIPATEQLTDKSPEQKERLERIVELCNQIGDPAVYRLLQLSEKGEKSGRMRALLLLGQWQPSRAIAPLLQRLFSEKDPTLQRMVRDNLRGYRKRSEFHKLLQFLRDNLRSTDDHRLQKAIFFLSDLRIAEAVPDLIALLEHTIPAVRENTLFALRNLALQDYGMHIENWRNWYQSNAQFDRKNWVVDALNHEEKAIRHLAKEELRVEFGDDFGYSPQASPAEREAVQKLAGLWLQKG